MTGPIPTRSICRAPHESDAPGLTAPAVSGARNLSRCAVLHRLLRTLRVERIEPPERARGRLGPVTSRVAMVLVIVTLVAAGCTRTPTPVSKSSPTPTPSPLVWADCNGGFQCATVEVPLDYAHPAAGTIGIAISRKPATDPARRIGSVLTNPGGPGASGIQFLRGEAGAMSALNALFDLIG